VATLAVAAVIAAAFAPFIPHGGVRAVYDHTLGSQAGRASPFSIWGQYGSLADVWTAVKVFAVALAIGVAFVPRAKTPGQVAALGAAVLVALQMAVAHWFYLYIVWFAPFVFVALFLLYRDPSEEEVARPAAVAAPARPTAEPVLT
jgi:hypothetical protein